MIQLSWLCFSDSGYYYDDKKYKKELDSGYYYIYMKKCLQHEKKFRFNTKPTLLKSCLLLSYFSVVLADIIITLIRL